MSIRPDTLQQILQRSAELDHGIFAVGIEILPYELVGVITDAHGRKLGGCRRYLLDMEPALVVKGVATIARYLVTAALGRDLPDQRLCLGLQLGGPVDPATGVVRFYSNSPDDHGKDKPPYYRWSEVPLGDDLRREIGCATVVENDAHAYAAYEQKMGIGRNTGSFAVILIRHGVGAGIVVDHQLMRIPMELGHYPVWPRGRTCDCGKRGCLESQAGSRAIPAVVRELTGRAVDSFEAAVSLADGNDRHAAIARHAFRKAGTSVARGIATILTTFGSSHVVIYAAEDLIDVEHHASAACFLRAVRRFDKDTFHVARSCELTTEPLRSARGAQGAALLALNRTFSVPLQPC